MTRKKSDLSRAFTEDGALKTHVGGQALLEGVMMRGRYNWSVAVREPDGGIYTEEHDLASGKRKNGWLYWPIVRGCRAFVESLVIGYKALSVAAEHAFVDEDEDGAGAEGPAVENRAFEVETPVAEVVEDQATGVSAGKDAPRAEAAEDAASKTASEPLLSGTEMALSMVLGLVLGIVLFIVAPAFITNLIVGEYDDKTLTWNIVDGLLRIAVFIFYIWLIGRMSDIKRMFAYHGAEHKTIHCYEHGLALTPENAADFPRLHVRCGTAFLIMVMIIAIFVYTVTPLNGLIAAWGIPDGAPKLVFVILARIVLMPVIAGVSYEITVKWAGTHPNNPLVKVVLWPGLQMQYLTTREPGPEELECAIKAMQLVLEREEAEAKRMGSAAVGDLRSDGKPVARGAYDPA